MGIYYKGKLIASSILESLHQPINEWNIHANMDKLRADAQKEGLDEKSFIKKHYNFSPKDVQKNYIHIMSNIGPKALFNHFMADYEVTFPNDNGLLKSLKPDSDGFVYTPGLTKKTSSSGELSAEPYYFDRGSRGSSKDTNSTIDVKALNKSVVGGVYKELGKGGKKKSPNEVSQEVLDRFGSVKKWPLHLFKPDDIDISAVKGISIGKAKQLCASTHDPQMLLRRAIAAKKYNPDVFDAFASRMLEYGFSKQQVMAILEMK